MSGNLSKEIAILIGTIYPALKSIQALQTDTDVEDDRTWLTYWLCYGAFTVADMHVGWILSFIPFYYTMKLFFLIWLQLPLGPFMGAKIIYRFFLMPIFRVIGPAINAFTERHADEIYELKREYNEGMADLQKQAVSAGTAMYLEKALN